MCNTEHTYRAPTVWHALHLSSRGTDVATTQVMVSCVRLPDTGGFKYGHDAVLWHAGQHRGQA